MKRMRLAAAGLACLFAAAGAHGEDGPRGKAPRPFVRASVASSTQLKAAATDLGLPAIDIARFIELRLPVVGQNAINSDRPLGILLLAGEGLPPQKMTVIALPVKAGKTTVADLVSRGGRALEDPNDMVRFNEQTLVRRTADYVYLYPGEPAIIKDLGNDVFGADFTSKESLAHIDIDGATARAIAPRMYKDYLEDIRMRARAQARPGASEAERRAQEIGQDFIMSLLEKMERSEATLSKGDKTLRLSAHVAPSPMPGKREFDKPKFPPGAIATGHMVYPNATTAGWGARLWAIIPDATLSLVNEKLKPEQLAAQRGAINAMGDAVVADAQSFAVENQQGMVTITVVNQYSRDVDLPATLKKGITTLNDLLKEVGRRKSPLTLADVKGTDGTNGLKIVDSRGGEAMILQRGRMAVITLSNAPIQEPSAIMLSSTEKISDVADVRADLGALARMLGNTHTLREEESTLLADKLAGKEATLKISNDASGGMQAELDLPVELVRCFPLLAGNHEPAPVHAPAPAPAK